MISKRHAKIYRRQMVNGAKDLPDEAALTVPMLYDRWEIGLTYTAGLRLYYNGKLYKVLIGHTSQEGWEPNVAVSLFAEVLIPDPEVIPDWVQPSSANPYMTGDKVRHSGKVWVSLVDNNVWEPGTVGTESLWQEVTGA